MKIKETLISVAKNRSIVAGWIAMCLLGIALIIITALQVHYSELQTLTRYTAFGDTKLYSSHWYYLLNFVVFGLILLILHSFIGLRLYDRKGSRLTLLFIALSIALLLIAFFILLALLSMVSLP